MYGLSLLTKNVILRSLKTHFFPDFFQKNSVSLLTKINFCL